jgi:hypothetical protein
MTPPTVARRWLLVPGATTQENLRRYRLVRLEAIAYADADPIVATAGRRRSARPLPPPGLT